METGHVALELPATHTLAQQLNTYFSLPDFSEQDDNMSHLNLDRKRIVRDAGRTSPTPTKNQSGPAA